MRDKIRLPADVELSTKLTGVQDMVELTGEAKILVESVPAGKFNKITKITIQLPEMGDVIVIVPKERSPRPFNAVMQEKGESQ